MVFFPLHNIRYAYIIAAFRPVCNKKICFPPPEPCPGGKKQGYSCFSSSRIRAATVQLGS